MIDEKERRNGLIVSFIIVTIGIYGFIIDSYTDPDNPIIPNVINILFNINIIPDQSSMYDESFYIKNQSMIPININGHLTVAYDITKQKENKISGSFFYMIMCFIPLFIILLSGANIEKINKKKIKKVISSLFQH